MTTRMIVLSLQGPFATDLATRSSTRPRVRIDFQTSLDAELVLLGFSDLRVPTEESHAGKSCRRRRRRRRRHSPPSFTNAFDGAFFDERERRR
jgi:hypothetical protein|tara:strand:+ start:178 stop:456 length:279 start_codon:yes stop_codon:yes gene_type:complete